MRRNASGGVEATPEMRQVVAYFRESDCMKGSARKHVSIGYRCWHGCAETGVITGVNR
jgi:hypothetical protein